MRRTVSLPMALFLASILSGATGCTDDADRLPNAPDETQAVALVNVTPPGGAVGVDPSSHVVLEFDHPMVDGMEQFCAVHVGGLDGSEVPGHWEWASDHHTLTLMPDQPFAHETDHLVHVGGGMMGGGHDHSGEGWEHQNGTFGMAFEFTTGQ